MGESIPLETSIALLTYLDLKANGIGSGHLKTITKNISLIELYSRERGEFVEIPRERLQNRVNRYLFRSGKGEELSKFSGILLKILNYSGAYSDRVRVLFGDNNSFAEDGNVALYRFYGRLNKEGDKVTFGDLSLFYY